MVLTITIHAAEGELAFPLKEWEPARPEALGYSSEKLTVLRAWLGTQQTTALHASVAGRVVFDYGEVARTSKVASVRKSVLAMLFGRYIEEGKVDPNKTVEQLGLGDVQPFLPIEKVATLQHLLTARSGVYLPTANGELTELSPRRGSQAQDFARSLQRKNSEMPISKHPEYAMYLSTRDMARLGLLMLSDGRWGSKQVMPKGWANHNIGYASGRDSSTGNRRIRNANRAMGIRNAVVGLGRPSLAWNADGTLPGSLLRDGSERTVYCGPAGNPVGPGAQSRL